MDQKITPKSDVVLATIGYEGAGLAAIINRLTDAGVAVVIDLRAIAASRRPGFSKSMLSGSLADAGIDYVHLRALGTPKAGREAVRAGRIADMVAIYESHLEEPEAQAQLAWAADIIAARPAALLCYEADFAHCHRTIVAGRLHDRVGCEIVNL